MSSYVFTFVLWSTDSVIFDRFSAPHVLKSRCITDTFYQLCLKVFLPASLHISALICRNSWSFLFSSFGHSSLAFWGLPLLMYNVAILNSFCSLSKRYLSRWYLLIPCFEYGGFTELWVYGYNSFTYIFNKFFFNFT